MTEWTCKLSRESHRGIRQLNIPVQARLGHVLDDGGSKSSTSLGFAFYAVQDASAVSRDATVQDNGIRDRLAQLHAARDAGGFASRS